MSLTWTAAEIDAQTNLTSTQPAQHVAGVDTTELRWFAGGRLARGTLRHLPPERATRHRCQAPRRTDTGTQDSPIRRRAADGGRRSDGSGRSVAEVEPGGQLGRTRRRPGKGRRPQDGHQAEVLGRWRRVRVRRRCSSAGRRRSGRGSRRNHSRGGRIVDVRVLRLRAGGEPMRRDRQRLSSAVRRHEGAGDRFPLRSVEQLPELARRRRFASAVRHRAHRVAQISGATDQTVTAAVNRTRGDLSRPLHRRSDDRGAKVTDSLVRLAIRGQRVDRRRLVHDLLLRPFRRRPRPGAAIAIAARCHSRRPARRGRHSVNVNRTTAGFGSPHSGSPGGAPAAGARAISHQSRCAFVGTDQSLHLGGRPAEAVPHSEALRRP